MPRRTWRDTHYAAFGRWLDRKHDPDPDIFVEIDLGIILGIILGILINMWIVKFISTYLKGNP